MQFLVGALLVAPFLAFAPVVTAATTEAETSTSSTSPTTSDDTTKEVEDEKKETFEQGLKKLVEAEGKKQTQADRLKAKTAELKIKLSAAEQAKLKASCVAAQAKVKTLGVNVDTGVINRGKAYDELLSHLDKIITKLKAAKVDTVELEKERTELKAKIDTFKTDLAKYKIALDDTKSLGCVADPSSFKTALETARSARTLVATDAAAVRAYVNDTIKPTLKTIRTTVENKKTTDESSTSDTTTTPTTTGGAQ